MTRVILNTPANQKRVHRIDPKQGGITEPKGPADQTLSARTLRLSFTSTRHCHTYTPFRHTHTPFRHDGDLLFLPHHPNSRH